MPAEFALGTDADGTIDKVWGWAAGHEGWRSPPRGTPVMVRAICMQRKGVLPNMFPHKSVLGSKVIENY